jgi:hypothetical protein
VEEIPRIEERGDQRVARREIRPVDAKRDADEHHQHAGRSGARQEVSQQRNDLPCERVRARDAALDVTDDQCGCHEVWPPRVVPW